MKMLLRKNWKYSIGDQCTPNIIVTINVQWNQLQKNRMKSSDNFLQDRTGNQIKKQIKLEQ